MVRPVTDDARGILDPGRGLRRFTLERHSPSPPVARFVDRYWIGRWDLPPGEDHVQEVLAHPVVNLTVTADDEGVHGPTSGRTERRLAGRGWVLGVMTRPGGARPLLDGPLRRWVDRSTPVGELFGPDGEELVAAVRRREASDEAITDVDRFLAGRLPEGPHPCERVVAIAERIAADPTTVTVEGLARAEGLSPRHLERLFAEHVGPGPKWVIRRYRLYEAAERAARGGDVHWATLATELGYADQSHLIRDVTAAVGEPPDRYARRCAEALAGATGPGAGAG